MWRVGGMYDSEVQYCVIQYSVLHYCTLEYIRVLQVLKVYSTESTSVQFDLVPLYYQGRVHVQRVQVRLEALIAMPPKRTTTTMKFFV